MGEARRKKQAREQEQRMIHQGEQQMMDRCRADIAPAGFRKVPLGERKMSETIEEYAQPLLAVVDDHEAQKQALRIAIALWNLSFLPGEERQRAIDETLWSFRRLGPAAERENRQVMGFMLQRKHDFFPDVMKIVLDFEFVNTEAGFHFSVVSGPIEKNGSVSESVDKDKEAPSLIEGLG